jgi:hypothetical protein
MRFPAGAAEVRPLTDWEYTDNCGAGVKSRQSTMRDFSDATVTTTYL